MNDAILAEKIEFLLSQLALSDKSKDECLIEVVL